MLGFPRIIWHGTGGLQRHLRDTISSTAAKKYSARSSLVFFFLLFFLGGGLFATRFLDTAVSSISVSTTTPPKTILSAKASAHVYPNSKIPKKPLEIPLNCSSRNPTFPSSNRNNPAGFGLRGDQGRSSPSATCPDYFRWIHDDLRPWRETGITAEMVERAGRTANFRLVIVDGRAYMVKYRRAFQTRDVYTLWGILQLLRRYPGKVPDLDLMFDCFDRPVVRSADYSGPNATAPPPLFRYCGDDATLDIAFPDWTFWGWPELNIKPWERLVEELKEGNKRKRWIDRESYAYWKGNPMVAANRMDLLKCNVSEKHHIDWGARLFPQDWIRESQQGYKQSDLASQCIHRYKIYIEGTAWSVSEKYILACDSVTLVVKPRYYDFFSRSLMPMHHYWPIRDDDKCRSIKFAVDWGNSHKQKAQSIGKAASDFIQKELKMDYVYDYMFHLLNEYAKLMRYKPTVPRKAIELCSDTMACSAKGSQKKFMMESIVKGPADVSPCTMPPPYDPVALHSVLKQKSNSTRQVELWEKKFWDTQITHS